MISEAVKKQILGMPEAYDKEKTSFLLDYTLSGGKEFRYKSYLHILSSLNGDMNESNLTIGYTTEILQAALLIVDDIMDNSELRRGKPCYYLKRGMGALKDAFFLLAIIRRLLPGEVKRYYSIPVLRTCLGQTHDTLRKTRDQYRIETYTMIAENKTGAYTLYLPSIFGYAVAGAPVPTYLWEFCRLGALLFQMEDDYLNFLPEKSDKSMNDLEEMKCTWFSSRIAVLNNETVDRYFSNGTVTVELVGIVKTFFQDYFSSVDALLKQLSSMIEESDKKTLDVFIKYLEERKLFE